MDSCAYPDCRLRVHKRGWCARHYRNWRHHGDPGIHLSMMAAVSSLPDEAWDRPPPLQRPDIRSDRQDAFYPPWRRKPQPEWVLYCCGRCEHRQVFPPREKPVPCLACGENPVRARGMCERCYQRARTGIITPPPPWQPDEPCTLCGAHDWNI